MFLITNRNLCDKERYYKVISESCRGGVDNIIVREKDLPEGELMDLFKRINFEIPEDIRKKINLIVNSSISVYEMTICDGIHLPFHLFKEQVNKSYKFNPKKLIGLSLHSIEDIKEMNDICAENDIKVDYITLSHIFETKCKEGLKPKGIELLKNSIGLTNAKRVALGGISLENAAEVLKYCDDFAVMSAIMKSDDGKAMAENFVSKEK